MAQGFKYPSPWDELKGQIYLGSDAFRARMQERLTGRTSKGIPRRQLNPVRPSAQAVIRAVADTYRIKPAAALQRQSGPVFKQAVYLLRRLANLSLSEVATLAGVTIGRVAQIQSEIESVAPDQRLQKIVDKL